MEEGLVDVSGEKAHQVHGSCRRDCWAELACEEAPRSVGKEGAGNAFRPWTLLPPLQVKPRLEARKCKAWGPLQR